MRKKLLCILLSLVMLIGVLPLAVFAEDSKGQKEDFYKTVYDETGKYLLGLCEKNTPVVSSTGGEWAIIGLARAGISEDEINDGWYQNVLSTVNSKINAKEQLHTSKSTENERVILALTAAGYDVTDVGGHNLLQGLTDIKYLKKQGINGPIWALIAFDSHNYEIPEDKNGGEQATREAIIDYILSKKLTDGGWALSGKTPDPDMTGMVIQALAPYYNVNENVKIAIDESLTTLSNIQKENGGFASWGTVNSESCAQVIVALTALGIDPATDDRFVKDGNSVIDAMCEFAVDGGGFKHTMTTGLNGMATEQAYYALASYFRYKENKNSLYNMTDVHIFEDDHTFEYVYDEHSHWLECSCGITKENADLHTFYEWIEVTAATTENEGLMERTCSVCGYKESKAVSKVLPTVIDDKTPLMDAKADVTQAETNNEVIANTADNTNLVASVALTLSSAISVAYVLSLKKKEQV